ncbi:MFS transporter [Granulicella arctica]|uniref:MFS family permease n=1 Tax=Granulicella arctica TaxID=940613 RepID=A0A7Y9PI85_9BACT|nr:MFS transporter [Granulicella arctica]NYF79593.1 MFS family permease [Granulicella arctica]
MPDQLSLREVLGIRAVRLMWFALIISTFGDFLALFAVLSVVSFKMNAAAEQITWVQIASLLPPVLIGPLAGVFVDRWPLKSTLVSSDLIRVFLSLMLLGATHLWQFCLILGLMSVVGVFFGPAQQCTIRASVPPEGIMAASAVMQQVSFVIWIISPGIAGLLVASFGAVSCYLIDAVSFVASAMLIGSIAIRKRTVPTQENPADTTSGIHKIWLDMREGFSFIVHHKAILFVTVALAAAVFTLGCFGPLIAVYVRESLHGATRLFGIISSMIGLGILLGFVIVQKLAKTYSNKTLVFGGLVCMAAGFLALGLVPLLAVTIVAALAIGFSVAMILLPGQTLVQQDTPEELMGRVSSTGMSIVFGSQVLGLFVSGMMTKFMGVQQVFLVSAIFLLGLVFMGKLALRSRSN